MNPRVCCLVATCIVLTVPVAASGADADLATAKSLYASASYDEALHVLDSLEAAAPAGDAAQIEQYRALCLVAIGRTAEAEQSLERIVLAHPLYHFEGEEVSPKLITLYQSVRKRVLPAAAKDLYANAKAKFESKQFEEAAAGFEQVMAVINEAGEGSSTLADLKQLSDGFLLLSQSEVAAAEAARAARAKAAASPPPPPVVTAPPVYTLSDGDVTPPVAISADPPAWSPRSAIFAERSFKGLLQVVIDEQGNVESLTLEQPVSPDYDAELLDAAKRWKFSPATKDGRPVKFMKRLEIILQPRHE
jgi:TonB family protein